MSPEGLISIQTSWSADGENVRIIDPVTGTAGFQTAEYVAEWRKLYSTTANPFPADTSAT